MSPTALAHPTAAADIPSEIADRSPVGRIALEAPMMDAAAERIHAALVENGFEVDRVDGLDRVVRSADRTLPRILVAHHALSPERAAAAMREDAPHLPIVFADGECTVGPYVVPGRTVCTACLHAHRRDADAQWPLTFAHLLMLPVYPVTAGLAAEAGHLAARLLRGQHPWLGAGDGLASTGHAHSVTVDEHSARRAWRTHAPHPECGCRSLPESATESAPLAPRWQTTSARAFARRA